MRRVNCLAAPAWVCRGLRHRVVRGGGRSALAPELVMLLARLLNACHHFPGFVYAAVRLVEATSTIEVDVRPRRGSKAHCSCCGKAAAGYDVLSVRRFEFIPIWAMP